jgi:hypothetical protein
MSRWKKNQKRESRIDTGQKSLYGNLFLIILIPYGKLCFIVYFYNITTEIILLCIRICLFFLSLFLYFDSRSLTNTIIRKSFFKLKWHDSNNIYNYDFLDNVPYLKYFELSFSALYFLLYQLIVVTCSLQRSSQLGESFAQTRILTPLQIWNNQNLNSTDKLIKYFKLWGYFWGAEQNLQNWN